VWVYLQDCESNCIIVILLYLALLISIIRALSSQNSVTCLRHCRCYHQRLFISLPVCLATRAYERPPTVVSSNPAWASFRSLSNHTTYNLSQYQLDARTFNTFITILYKYMFRAISCSSSGGQIVLIQHLVSSLLVSDRPLHSSTCTCFEQYLAHPQEVKLY
jgi:hypothetical protein